MITGGFLFVQHLSCCVDHKNLDLINIALGMIIIASYYKALFQSSHIQGCKMTCVVKFIVWFSFASKLSNTLAKKYISVLPDRVIWSITQTKACTVYAPCLSELLHNVSKLERHTVVVTNWYFHHLKDRCSLISGSLSNNPERRSWQAWCTSGELHGISKHAAYSALKGTSRSRTRPGWKQSCQLMTWWS